MIKLASVALAGALGVAGLAQACPVEVVVPRIVYAPAYYHPGYYTHDRDWRWAREHYGDRDRYWHRDRDDRWHREWDRH